MAHPRHEEVRRRYSYRCGYCGVSETDAGGDLTVDHFRPFAHVRDESPDNLVYACVRCNQHKGAFSPAPDTLDNPNRLLHPLLDDVSAHITEDKTTGILIGITPRGRFHIQALRLNRRGLVDHRVRQQAIFVMETRLQQAEAEKGLLRDTLDETVQYIRDLEARNKDT